MTNTVIGKKNIIFAKTDSGVTTVFDALSLCIGCMLGYIAMEIIAYATVPGLWPGHLIYLDKYEMIY